MHRHWTTMSKAFFTSPKVRNQAYRKRFSLTFSGGLRSLQTKARVNPRVAKGLTWNSLLPHTGSCGFSPCRCSSSLLPHFPIPFLAVSEEQKANAKPLEPAFEALLRTVDLDEELITILRVRNVLDREISSSLEMNEEKFRETIASACGIDNTNFEHKLETAKLVKAWQQVGTLPHGSDSRSSLVLSVSAFRKGGPDDS